MTNLEQQTTRVLSDGHQIIRNEKGDTFIYHEARGVVSGRFNGIDEIQIERRAYPESVETQGAKQEEVRLFGRTGSMLQPLILDESTGFYRAGAEYTDVDYVPGVGICGGHGSMKYVLGDRECLPVSDTGYHKIERESDGRLWGMVGNIHEPVRLVPEGTVRIPR